MKKFYLFLCLFLMSFCAWAQHVAPCDFHIRTEVTAATCYNNGKVLVTPVDGAGNELTILPDSLFDENNPGHGLSGIKYCYKNLYSATDTAEQCQYDPLLVLDTGTYIIHAEVLCFDPTQSGDDRYTLLSDTGMRKRPLVTEPSLRCGARTQDGCSCVFTTVLSPI